MERQSRQSQYVQSKQQPLLFYKISLIFKALELPFRRVVSETFSLLISVNEEELFTTQIADMGVLIYKVYKGVYDRNRRTALHLLWKNKEMLRLRRALTNKVTQKVQSLKFEIGKMSALYKIMAGEKLGSEGRRMGRLQEGFSRLKLFKKDNFEKRLKLKELSDRRLVLRLENRANPKMLLLFKRYLTKLYSKNIPREPLQLKYEAMSKMNYYLIKTRKVQSIKRRILNQYVTVRYLHLSRSLIKIKQSGQSEPDKTLLQNEDALKQVIKLKTKAEMRLGLKRLALFVKKRTRLIICKLRSSFRDSHIAPKRVRQQHQTHKDAKIFANSLTQYLYLLGHLSGKADAGRRRSQAIIRLLWRRQDLYSKNITGIYFKRFKELLPKYDNGKLLEMVRTLEEKQDEKEQLIKRLTD